MEFGLGGPFSWARRSVQIEALRKTMQEGHHTILETPAAACDVEELMQGLAGDSDGEPK